MGWLFDSALVDDGTMMGYLSRYSGYRRDMDGIDYFDL